MAQHPTHDDARANGTRRSRRRSVFLAIAGVLVLIAIAVTWLWWTERVTLRPGALAPLVPGWMDDPAPALEPLRPPLDTEPAPVPAPAQPAR